MTMHFDYRKVTIEICQGEIDCIKAVICFAFDHRKALADKLPEQFEDKLGIADGIYHAIKHAYAKTIDDDHEQVEPDEYAAAEGAFGVHQTQETVKVHGGTVCVTNLTDQEDYYAFCDPVLETTRGWREIPDLIGREAVSGRQV